MGRIADATEVDVNDQSAWCNRVDEILSDELDDDDDRAIVLGWLRSELSAPDIEFRFESYGIRCSDKSIQRWRRAQRLGRGRVWE